MRQRLEYIALRQAVMDAGYTIKQVQNATLSQAAQLAGVNESEIALYFEGMKSKIIAEMNSVIDEAKMDGIKNQVKTWLDNNFPNNVIEKDIVSGKLCVIIWPEGKP